MPNNDSLTLKRQTHHGGGSDLNYFESGKFSVREIPIGLGLTAVLDFYPAPTPEKCTLMNAEDTDRFPVSRHQTLNPPSGYLQSSRVRA